MDNLALEENRKEVEVMPAVVENLTQLDLTLEEAEFLQNEGILVQQEDNPEFFDTTAWVWDGLGLEGDDALDFIEAALKGFRKESRNASATV